MPDLLPIPPTAIQIVPPPGLPDVEALLAGRLAASSLAGYRRNIAAYVAWCSAHHVLPTEPRSLAAWRSDLVSTTQLSAATINRALAAVKRLCKESASQEYLPAEIAAKFAAVDGVSAKALKSRMRAHNKTAITPAAMRQLCDSPDPTTLRGLRDRALLTTLAMSGMRISEAVGLRWADLRQVEGGWLASVCGKTDTTPRDVLVGQRAIAYIQAWRTARGWADGYIFTSTRGHGQVLTRTPLTPAGAWLLVQGYAATCGLEHVKPHDLRRFLASQLIKRHGIREAQQALGHKSLETTTKYDTNTMAVGLSDDLF